MALVQAEDPEVDSEGLRGRRTGRVLQTESDVAVRHDPKRKIPVEAVKVLPTTETKLIPRSHRVR